MARKKAASLETILRNKITDKIVATEIALNLTVAEDVKNILEKLAQGFGLTIISNAQWADILSTASKILATEQHMPVGTAICSGIKVVMHDEITKNQIDLIIGDNK